MFTQGPNCVPTKQSSLGGKAFKALESGHLFPECGHMSRCRGDRKVAMRLTRRSAIDARPSQAAWSSGGLQDGFTPDAVIFRRRRQNIEPMVEFLTSV